MPPAWKKLDRVAESVTVVPTTGVVDDSVVARVGLVLLTVRGSQALVAALLGFTGIASAAAGIAKFLFFLFLVMCLIFFIIGMSVGRKVL